MMLKRTILTLTLIAAVAAARAQEIFVGVEFDTYFDNREYAANDFADDGTLFTGQIVPMAGIRWQERNSLVFGMELVRHFGDHTGEGDRVFSDVKPRMYYKYEHAGVEAIAGIFSFGELSVNSYSRAIFNDENRFYHSCESGFMGRYTSQKREDSFVELVLDWEGMYSEECREMFRIVSGGRYSFGRNFYFGYGFSLLHFANSEIADNLVDNMILNPYIGTEFTAWCDFDIRFGLLAAPQRGRSVDNEWQTPAGGELDITLRKKGFRLENNLYLGDNLQPLRNIISMPDTGITYGNEGLYAGESFYSTTKGIYNRTWIGYENSFFDDTVTINAGMAFHYDGSALGTQQLVQFSVCLEKLFDKKK